MSFYQANLAAFAAGNAYLLYRQYQREQKPAPLPVPAASGSDSGSDRDVEHELPEGHHGVAGSREAVRKFQWDFFLVYALAVAADWLQVCSFSASFCNLSRNLGWEPR